MKIYISKEHQKEDMRQTAYAFLFVSLLGFLLLILFATGILPLHVALYRKIMLCIVMGIMFLIFFVIGIRSFLQLKTLDSQADSERQLEDEIRSWFVDTFDAASIDSLTDPSDDNLYFGRYAVMTEKISEKYPSLEETFLDHLIEELYPVLFTQQ